MKTIPVAEAEGAVLCHDITEIVPGQCKRRAFKKGHVVRQEDILRLLNLGKEHLYVWELGENMLHENDAAIRIATAVAGSGLVLTEPVEGKVELKADIAGLLKVNAEAVELINSIDQIVLATLHSNQPITPGRSAAGCRVVPLVIESHKIREMEEISRTCAPVIQIKPFRSMKVGVVTTGSEVYHGRIQDKFGPVLQSKVDELGSRVIRQMFAPDNLELIRDAIRALIREGAELILTTGGMSVDPDDVTPKAIKAAGGQVVVYGAPVLPGSMFMLAYIGEVPVLGLPGCVMYHKATIFDLVLPRILAGEKITRSDVVHLGHGGLCCGCESCHFPNCGFGKAGY